MTTAGHLLLRRQKVGTVLKRLKWVSKQVLVVASISAMPTAVIAQTIELTRVADLLGGEVLNLADAPRSGALVPMPTNGGWLYAGYLERWAWGQFDPNGQLNRVGGKEWIAGGPGEFRNVRAVLPLSGDTLLVLEPYNAHRVLIDGTYVDTRPIPFNPGPRWASHGGKLWISGQSLRVAGMPLMRIDMNGDLEVFRIQARGTEEQQVGVHPVSWSGELWVWEYPRGPLRRIDTASGQVAESWDPPIGRAGSDTWGAFAVTGPDDTIIFRIDPTFEWVAFDNQRNKILTQPIPPEYRGVYFINEAFGRAYASENEPVHYLSGIRVYRYRIVR